MRANWNFPSLFPPPRLPLLLPLSSLVFPRCHLPMMCGTRRRAKPSRTFLPSLNSTLAHPRPSPSLLPFCSIEVVPSLARHRSLSRSALPLEARSSLGSQRQSGVRPSNSSITTEGKSLARIQRLQGAIDHTDTQTDSELNQRHREDKRHQLSWVRLKLFISIGIFISIVFPPYVVAHR